MKFYKLYHPSKGYKFAPLDEANHFVSQGWTDITIYQKGDAQVSGGTPAIVVEKPEVEAPLKKVTKTSSRSTASKIMEKVDGANSQKHK